MRLIDADAYAAEMKTRQDACKETIDNAVEDERWEVYDRMSSAYSVFIEAKLTLDAMPTIDAVPVVRCIQTALPFEYGKVYPICGWNNGVHIIGVSEQGDPVDLVCHNYGDELWDAEKTDGIECLGARFVYCADGERKDGEG